MPGYEELMAKINRLKREGGVGYTETRTLTFDGDATGKHVTDFGGGVKYLHISNEVIDANKIVKMVAVIDGVAVDGSVIRIDNPEAGLSIVTGQFGDTTLSTVLICEKDAPSYNAKKGVSVLFDPNGVLHGYSIVVSRIETETINTINPKYLPEGGVGYTEGGTKTLTFDGDMTGKEQLQVPETEGAYFVKISDKPFSLDEFQSIDLLLYGESEPTRTKDYLYFAENDEMHFWAACLHENEGDPVLEVLTEDMVLEGTTFRKGVYVLCMPDSVTWVEKVVYGKETIHPIADKYLPGAIDLDDLGLTPTILDLMESGGGRDIGENNADGIDVIKVCKEFEQRRGYAVKLTIPDMGVMYVNPVYTTITNGRFKIAHFDSYLVQNEVFMKFYVRIAGRTSGEKYTNVGVTVGFY